MGHYIQAVSVRWYNACAYYAVTLARGLAACGHRVTVAGDKGTPVLEKAREWGIDCLCGTNSQSYNPLRYLDNIRRYRKYALDNDVTLVNAHNGRDHLTWALALWGTGIPLVRTSGNRIPPKNHIGARYLIRKTNGIIATCDRIRSYYVDRFGIDRSAIPSINGGVDSSFFFPDYASGVTRESFGIPRNSYVFGIIGRYSLVKGHRYFFDAAGIVAQKFPDVWFVVSGWDADMSGEDVRKMAEEAGVADRTLFIERQHDIRGLIGMLDAGVISSVGSETVCRIAMEYMAMGIPVIAADTNVIPEVIRHGESGIIVPSGSGEAMAAAMEQVVQSQENGRAMGSLGRNIVETEYALVSFAEQTHASYERFSGNG